MSVYLFGVRRPPVRPAARKIVFAVAREVGAEHGRDVTFYTAQNQSWFCASPQLGAPFDDALAADVYARLAAANVWSES